MCIVNRIETAVGLITYFLIFGMLGKTDGLGFVGRIDVLETHSSRHASQCLGNNNFCSQSDGQSFYENRANQSWSR